VYEAARDPTMLRFWLIHHYLEQMRSLESSAIDAELYSVTVHRWISSCLKFGLVALVRKSRDDRGGSTKIKVRETHQIIPTSIGLFCSCPAKRV
jgi:hypothetical protein